MRISTTKISIAELKSENCFIFLFEDELTVSANQLDTQSKGFIKGLIDAKQASNKLGKVTPVYGHESLDIKALYLVGCGKKASFTENSLIKVMSAIATIIQEKEASSIDIALTDLELKDRTVHWLAQKSTETLLTSLYKYSSTKSKKPDAPNLESINYVADEDGLNLAIETGKGMAHGINVARELGNLPGNICTPTYVAEQAEKLAEANEDITTKVIDETKLEEMGMGCFMSVSKGSVQPGKLICIEYNGASEDQKPHVLVGKGITFDTGGISLKPGAQMDEMKFDMCGAASVVGTMNALAELKPSINVVGIIVAAENMPSGNATKPGDIVTSYSGKTVEILNTDAEGRLVLCDALTYAERYEPESVIDIATLTGAIIVALGHHPTAVYSNDSDLQQQILDAGTAAWDRGWPMPLWEDYSEEVDSPYADLQNLGNSGRAGGSISAAVFLSKFAEKFKWAHLDIAGTAWTNRKSGASGRPVAMLTQYLLDKAS